MNYAGFAGRSGLFVLVPVSIVLMAGVVCAGRTALPAASTPTGTGRYVVRVMTFNIRVDTILDVFNGWSDRRDMVCDVISNCRPDILGLQEALKHQLDDILRDLDGYKAIGVGRKDGRTKGEYNCILYRTDRFQLIDSGTFWLSDTPETPGSASWGNLLTRICTWGRFANKWTGRAFYVYNLHLDYFSQRSREKSAQLLASRLQARDYNDPFIVTGDFNADERNSVMRYLKGHAAGALGIPPIAMIDTFRALYPHKQTVGTRNGFGGTCNGRKIDYILAGPQIRVLQADIIRRDRRGRYPSDHFPVTATLLID